jgi:hypothetical protein
MLVVGIAMLAFTKPTFPGLLGVETAVLVKLMELPLPEGHSQLQAVACWLLIQHIEHGCGQNRPDTMPSLLTFQHCA